MIDHATIAKIFETSDIVEVVSDFINLKKTGQNYKGLSPFTNEKTPSFFVSPSKQIFKCFSSGVGGNVVTFIMEHEKLSYPEALKYLARKYHIEIIEKEESQEEKQQKNERESLFSVSTYAQKYFTECLKNTEEGKAIGLSYFKERGFRDDIINKFQLGYSREQKDAFTKTAVSNGYKIEYLLKTGLSIQKGDFSFDRFHGRVIFPIHGLSGQVIGFGGRILKSDEKTAKYLNSPESEIYHKSSVLYGLYFGKQSIIKNEKCFLVEGYTDVLSLHQAGIENVVASSGTSLTHEQIRLIKRFSKNITVIYDGDEAGIKASLRGIDLILEEGLNVKVVLMPDGEDPDSFAKSRSANEALDFILKNECDFITFKTKILLKEAENDPVRRATLINDIVKSIAIIPDNITRTVYIKECSRMVDVNENILYAEIRKKRREKADQVTKKINYQPDYSVEKQEIKKIDSHPTTQFHIEKEIIWLLLNYGNEKVIPENNNENNTEVISVAEFIIREFETDDLDFQNSIFKIVFEEIKIIVSENNQINEKDFIFHSNEEIARVCIDILSTTYQLSEIWKKHDNYVETEDMRLKPSVYEAVYAFKNQKVKDLIKETHSQLKKAQEAGDMENIMLLHQRNIILNELRKDFSKNLGDRIE